VSGKEVKVIAVDPGSPHTLYVGMGLGGGGVWRSTDDGSSWQAAGLGDSDVTALAVHPASGALWAGTGDTAWRSTDGGATWRDEGHARGLLIESFLFDPSNPRQVYAVGGGGVWTAEVAP
jgi:hypothetical protein